MTVEEFQTLFDLFRTPVLAKDEAKYSQMAWNIYTYIQKTGSVDQINRDFTEGTKSPIYQELELERRQRAAFGLILCGKLTLDDYIGKHPNLAAAEKKVSQELSTLFGEMYVKPSTNYQPIFNKLKEWSDNQSESTEGKEDVYKLSQFFYFLLKIMPLQIANSAFFIKAALSKASGEISKLLPDIESTTRDLERFNAEKLHEEQSSPLDPEGHISLQQTAEASSDMGELHRAHDELKKLQDGQQSLYLLLGKVSENNNKTIGRKYFKDLVSDNQKTFDVLIANLSEEEKIQFKIDREPIDNPSKVQSIKAATLAGVSWLSSPMTVIARTFTPAVIADSLQGKITLFETQDSFCKTKLQTLTEKTLKTVTTKIEAKKQYIEEVRNKKSELPLKPDESELMQMKEALLDFKSAQAIEHLSEKLKSIHGLDKDINNFVKQNNSTYKKFLGFFSRIQRFFSKNYLPLSAKIAHARTFQSELDGMKGEALHKIYELMDRINSNPNNTDEFKRRVQTIVNEAVQAIQLENKTKISNPKAEFAELKTRITALKLKQSDDLSGEDSESSSP